MLPQTMTSNQKASVELPVSTMSQIDFAQIQRMQQNSVQPNFYDHHFMPSHLQQHYANQNETQYSLDPVRTADRNVSGASPTIGRYRLKGVPYQHPVSHVYSNRVPNLSSDTKRTKSVRQRISRHLQPLSSTSVGGSNLRSGRKFVLTGNPTSGSKGYGTIEPKKTQTGYIPLTHGLQTIEPQLKQMQQLVATQRNKATTLVYGP